MQMLLTLLAILLAADPAATSPFAIEVVDDQTGRGVPLVELTTTAGVTYVTDSAGLVAFDEPGLMDRRVFFSVKSHGYESPQGRLWHPRRGPADVKPGGSAQIKIKRLNIAERLYRVTGQGHLSRHASCSAASRRSSSRCSNAQVTGCDSVVDAVVSRQALLVLGRHEPGRATCWATSTFPARPAR